MGEQVAGAGKVRTGVDLGELLTVPDQSAVLTAHSHLTVGSGRLSVHTGAVLVAGSLLTSGVHYARPGLGVRVSESLEPRAVAKHHRHSVVCLLGFSDLGVKLRFGVEVCQVEGVDLSIAVEEERADAVVGHDVPRLRAFDCDVSQQRLSGVVVIVLPVRLGPGAGVEQAEGFSFRDKEVATVSGRVDAQEALRVEVIEHF